MTLEETKELLRYIAAIDGRRVTPDTIRAWHDILAPYSKPLVWKASRIAIKNLGGKYLEISAIVDVIRSEQRTSTIRTCEHGAPIGAACHDCTHPPGCLMCAPVRGVSDTPEARRATVHAFAAKADHRSRLLVARHVPTPIEEEDPEW